MKNLMTVAAFFCFSVLGANTSFAISCPGLFSSPIEEVRSTIAGNQFNTVRDISEYILLLGQHFFAQLNKLDETSHIIDAGAGNGTFAKDIMGLITREPNSPEILATYRIRKKPLNKRPRVTAITYKIPHRVVESIPGKLNLLENRFFEDIPNSEITKEFGQADLILDAWGVLAYTDRPHIAIAKYYELLKPEGKIFMKVNSGFTSTMFNHTVTRKNGQVINFVEWLMSLPGFHAELFNDGEVLVLTKNPLAKGYLPNELVLTGVDDNWPPPPRYFVEK